MANLNYNHLRYFRAVAHEGNLTRAAERLNVSQSAISIQIQQLEEQFGHSLFERRGKQLILTEAGQIALDHADRIFSVGDDLVATMRASSAVSRRILRVGALATLSRNFQIGFLRPMLHRDDVEVVIRSGRLGDLLQGLEAHRLDILLINAPPARDAATSWIAHEIAHQTVSLVGHPRWQRPGASLRELLEQAPLVLPTAESSIRTGFDALANRLDIRPRIAAEVDDMAMLRVLAREDIGLCVVPAIVVRDELAAGSLVEVAALPDLTESFHALVLSRQFPNPLVRDLLDRARPESAGLDSPHIGGSGKTGSV